MRDMRDLRHKRIRKRVKGTAERPRFAVFRSLKHIYAQLIDDEKGTTIIAASSLEKKLENGGNLEGAKLVGKLLAEKAKEKGIRRAVFDRGGFRYGGRVRALADAAREEGLEF